MKLKDLKIGDLLVSRRYGCEILLKSNKKEQLCLSIEKLKVEIYHDHPEADLNFIDWQVYRNGRRMN